MPQGPAAVPSIFKRMNRFVVSPDAVFRAGEFANPPPGFRIRDLVTVRGVKIGYT